MILVIAAFPLLAGFGACAGALAGSSLHAWTTAGSAAVGSVVASWITLRAFSRVVDGAERAPAHEVTNERRRRLVYGLTSLPTSVLFCGAPTYVLWAALGDGPTLDACAALCGFAVLPMLMYVDQCIDLGELH